MIKIELTATTAWLTILRRILEHGCESSPRGQLTKEVLHNSIAFNMSSPVVSVPLRKLSYKFMAAEALWILRGDNSVAGIAPYNKNISQFSDNGHSYRGAYGPQIQHQIDHVIRALKKDTDSRQAVLTIWRPNPAPSKDIPCTIALTFNIRNNLLNCHAFMRSSDAWLGVPYDFFNFSMVACLILHHLGIENLALGKLYWTGVSSHLYEQHFGLAQEILSTGVTEVAPSVPVGAWKDWDKFEQALVVCRDNLDEKSIWKIRP